MKRTKKPTAIPVLPNARVGSIVGLLETLNEQEARIDIYKLSESLRFELNALMPITEAAELLGFVKIESGDIELADLGRKFVDGDENAKKVIFRQQMLANVLLARRIPRFVVYPRRIRTAGACHSRLGALCRAF